MKEIKIYEDIGTTSCVFFFFIGGRDFPLVLHNLVFEITVF